MSITPDQLRAKHRADDIEKQAADTAGGDAAVQAAIKVITDLGITSTSHGSLVGTVEDRWRGVVWAASEHISRRIAAAERQYDWDDPWWRREQAIADAKAAAIAELAPLRAFPSFRIRARNAVLVPHLADFR